MRLSSRAALAAVPLFLLACNRPAERDATAALDTGTANSSGTTQPGGGAARAAQTPAANATAPTAAVVVLYNFPKDTAAFEAYYRDKHIPLVGSHAQEIGFSRAVLTKFDHTADGKKPTYYREAQLWFPSEEAMNKGMQTAGFKAVAGDLPNFATNGQTILIAHETNNQ
jgi:uncharacterized protein (TIGR02118 family)